MRGKSRVTDLAIKKEYALVLKLEMVLGRFSGKKKGPFTGLSELKSGSEAILRQIRRCAPEVA